MTPHTDEGACTCMISPLIGEDIIDEVDPDCPAHGETEDTGGVIEGICLPDGSGWEMVAHKDIDISTDPADPPYRYCFMTILGERNSCVSGEDGGDK